MVHLLAAPTQQGILSAVCEPAFSTVHPLPGDLFGSLVKGHLGNNDTEGPVPSKDDTAVSPSRPSISPCMSAPPLAKQL